MKDLIKELVLQAVLDLRRQGVLPPGDEPQFVIERTRNKAHGDYACNVALLLAKPLARNPRELAQQLSASLPQSRLVEKVEVAGPGFINFFLSPQCLVGTLRRVFDQGERYGHAPEGSRGRVTVEFVSANPNGPLHVGHGRGAAYGASLANVLEASGYAVQREYYVNDAGRQMDILATSVWLRYLELGGIRVRFPDNGYKGDYVVEIARALRSREGDRLRRTEYEVFDDLPADESQGGDKELHVDALIARARKLLGDADYRVVFEAGLDQCLADIREDLAQFGVRYDEWFSERSLATSGAVAKAIETLKAKGHMYERDGALWFRATDFGDEKDRVVVRENGATTYFASDIAYLLNKFDRGFERAFYVLGADHHGYVARLKAAAQGLGLDPDRIEVLLVQFAVLYEGGQKVQMSTRAGQFVTLRQLREDVGADAARFFYVMRSHEQHLDFDLDLARSHSNDNPVYYVQYAHARVASLFRQLAEKGLSYNRATGDASRERLVEPHEEDLLQQLLRWPEILAGAADQRSPQIVVNGLRDLASAFHSFYNAVPILVEDDALRNARLYLASAAKLVLASGLKLLGVAAPETM
ncbi:MAG TPA: arginine--tRNA ligase [Xanthomonadales bacterium]|nr:arginine--tRNA ligase [Xanthomonadales bacterium]